MLLMPLLFGARGRPVFQGRFAVGSYKHVRMALKVIGRKFMGTKNVSFLRNYRLLFLGWKLFLLRLFVCWTLFLIFLFLHHPSLQAFEVDGVFKVLLSQFLWTLSSCEGWRQLGLFFEVEYELGLVFRHRRIGNSWVQAPLFHVCLPARRVGVVVLFPHFFQFVVRSELSKHVVVSWLRNGQFCGWIHWGHH